MNDFIVITIGAIERLQDKLDPVQHYPQHTGD
jgi:hypothetical protein